LPAVSQIQLNDRVLLFSFAASLLSGLVSGFAPAVKAARFDLHETLKKGGRGTLGGRHRAQRVGDTQTTQLVTVVDDELARTVFLCLDPIGKQIRVGFFGPNRSIEIVGVADRVTPIARTQGPDCAPEINTLYQASVY
jgi:hypothetical protein